MSKRMDKTELANRHYEEGVSLYGTFEFNFALVEFKIVERIHPFYNQLTAYIAKCLVALERYAEAVGYLEWEVQRDPEDLDAYVNLSVAYTVTKEYFQAERVALEGIDKHPDEPDLYCCLGDIMQLEGHPTIAVDFYRDALDLDPDHVASLNNLGNILGDHDKALKLFEKALRIEPNNLGILENAQRACLATGRNYRRSQLLRRMHRLDPNFHQRFALQQS